MVQTGFSDHLPLFPGSDFLINHQNLFFPDLFPEISIFKILDNRHD